MGGSSSLARINTGRNGYRHSVQRDGHGINFKNYGPGHSDKRRGQRKSIKINL